MAGKSVVAEMRIEGFDELMDTLSRVAPNEARQILRTAVHGLAGKVRDELKKNVAKDERDLEKSIKAHRRRGNRDEVISEVRGGSTAPYMLMLEYGTSKMDAKPFIVPTTEEFRPKLHEHYRTEFGQKFEAAIERKAKKIGKGWM